MILFTKRIMLCTVLVFAFMSAGIAGEKSSKAGTTVAQFLKIGIGGRAMAMAGANTATEGNIYGLYWNPASVIDVKNITFAGVNTNWFADIRHQFFGLVIPAGSNQNIGVQVITLNMDPIEVTTVSEQDGTGEFYEASDLAIGVTWASKLTNYFSIGITGKYIQQTIFNESASTYAFDVGSLLNIPYYGLKLGMNFSNFGGKMKLDGRDLIREYDLNPANSLNDGVEAKLKTEPWELPVNFRVGLAMDLIGSDKDRIIQNEKSRLTLAVDANHPSDAAEHLGFGLEYAFDELIMLRGGYKLNRDVEKFFYGVGLKAPISGAVFSFDYGLASFEELDYIHVFSASIAFE